MLYELAFDEFCVCRPRRKWRGGRWGRGRSFRVFADEHHPLPPLSEHLLEQDHHRHGDGGVQARLHNEAEDVHAEGDALDGLLPLDLRQHLPVLVVDGAAPLRVGALDVVGAAAAGGGIARCDLRQHLVLQELDVLLRREDGIGGLLPLVYEPVVPQAKLLHMPCFGDISSATTEEEDNPIHSEPSLIGK